MKRWTRKLVTLGIVTTLVTALSSCGTILHPERKGQVSGRIDPSIAILDGLGLLLYFIPGVIAFAVDFSNGTIYLPDDQILQLTPEEMDRVVENGKVDTAALARLAAVDEADLNRIQVREIDSLDSVR